MGVKEQIDLAWSHVSPDDLAMGAKAYPTYQSILRAMASHYGAPYVGTVEAFVALSPNSDYHGNLRSAASLLQAFQAGGTFEECTISTYRACGQRAWSYLTGEVSFLDTVGGKKITSFRDNILYPDTSKRITVDGHMIAIYTGSNFTMSQANLALRTIGYKTIEQEFAKLFRREKVPFPAGQAALWMSRKRRAGIKLTPQLNLLHEDTDWDRVIPPEEILPYPRRDREENDGTGIDSQSLPDGPPAFGPTASNETPDLFGS